MLNLGSVKNRFPLFFNGMVLGFFLAIIIAGFFSLYGDIFSPASLQAQMSLLKSDFRSYNRDSCNYLHRNITENDPFAGEQPYYSYLKNDVKYILSVGPDKLYSGGVPIYDPTNGSLSEGDIMTSITCQN